MSALENQFAEPQFAITPPYTIADFETFLDQPENYDQIFELINGEIVAVPSNPYVSKIAGKIIFFLQLFLVQNNLKDHVTAEAAGYIIQNNVYAPDVAYVSHDRQAELPRKGFNPGPPDLAVEVISDPTNWHEQQQLRRKIVVYLEAGVVVWIVDAEARTIEVYTPGEPMQVLGIKDTLTVEKLLPGFQLSLADLFDTKEEEE